ncbi:MAG: 2-oxoacid:acceptor oxidoreductase family protein [Nitrososphaeria archaeon]
MKHQILIAGKGGQGIQMMGYLLGYSFVKYQGKHVVQTEEYGASTRGGESYTELVVGDREEDVVLFKVQKADTAIFMFQQSWNSLLKKIQSDTTVIYDGSLVKPDRGRLFNIMATEISRNELKSPIVANMIMLGAISAVSRIVTLNELKSAINEVLSHKWEELNIRALETGYNKANELLYAENK